MLDVILNTVEDIVLVSSKTSKKEKVVFAFPFQGEIAKHYFDRTVSNQKENEIDGFNRTWRYDAEKGLIIGSSTFLTLRLDEELRQEGLWVPTPNEARILDEKGKLSNGIYRDFGIAVYSDNAPNKEIANEIINKTKGKLPLTIPFKNLSHRIDNNFPKGIALYLIENPNEIKSGKKAQELLDNFDYKANSGVCGLGRDWDSDWNASWCDLACSGSDGRVDWICGEATQKNLKSALTKNIQETGNKKTKELNDKIKSAEKTALKILMS